MGYPTEFPTIATDATFTAGAGVESAVVGQPVRQAPPGGWRSQGFVPGLGFVSEYVNHVLGHALDNLNWLFGRIQSDGDMYYETPKAKVSLYNFAHGFDGNPGFGDWNPYQGESLRSLNNSAEWWIPLRGLPPGVQVQKLKVRAKVNNNRGAVLRPPGSLARMELYRAKAVTYADTSGDMTRFGGIACWEPYYGGFTPPGPWFVNLPAVNGNVYGGPEQPFFIESGYEYAVRIIAGSDTDTHQTDRFHGLIVEWTDYGPRSGG